MSTVKATSQQRRVRPGRIALGVVLGLLALLLALYLADLAMNRGNVPRGTEVAGTPIGGMSPAEARAKLEAEHGDVATTPVEVVAGPRRATLVPAEAGLAVDWDATVAAAGVETANPISRLRGLFTTRPVEAVTSVDEALLEPALERVREELYAEPVDGAIRIDGGRAVTDPPTLGQEVDPVALRNEVQKDWLLADGVEIEPRVLQPAVNDDALKAAEQGPVRAALDGPLTVRGHSQAGGEEQPPVAAAIPQERLGEVIQFPVHEGKLVPEVKTEAAEGILAEQLAPTETTMTNARVLEGGGVTESVDGSVVDWDATLAGLTDRLIGTQPREWDATYKAVPADFTTEMAQHATFNEVVGSFTTGGYSGASGTNIALVAQTVNGAIVNPGETFSLNGYTGPRGTAQGYVESGIILNGRADNAVGGGISQFATTLYNAAYFAGMTDIAHTPHSYYISRYPAGREATVFEGAIDLQFRNDSLHPVKITTSVGGGQVTVSLMGVKTVTVESLNGGRWAQTSPTAQTVTGGSCVPSGGAPGFTTSDIRNIYDLSGNLLSSETQTTVYDPQPIVRCG